MSCVVIQINLSHSLIKKRFKIEILCTNRFLHLLFLLCWKLCVLRNVLHVFPSVSSSTRVTSTQKTNVSTAVKQTIRCSNWACLVS